MIYYANIVILKSRRISELIAHHNKDLLFAFKKLQNRNFKYFSKMNAEKFCLKLIRKHAHFEETPAYIKYQFSF